MKLARWIAIDPVPAPRMSKRDKWRGAQSPTVQRYVRYCEELRVRNVSVPPRCKVVFSMPMPKSWYKAEVAQMDGLPHIQKPDVDNLLKGLLDAVFYKRGGDEHIWSIWAEKVWGLAGGIAIYDLDSDGGAGA